MDDGPIRAFWEAVAELRDRFPRVRAGLEQEDDDLVLLSGLDCLPPEGAECLDFLRALTGLADRHGMAVSVDPAARGGDSHPEWFEALGFGEVGGGWRCREPVRSRALEPVG